MEVRGSLASAVLCGSAFGRRSVRRRSCRRTVQVDRLSLRTEGRAGVPACAYWSFSGRSRSLQRTDTGVVQLGHSLQEWTSEGTKRNTL